VEYLYSKHAPRVWDDTISLGSYDLDIHRIMPEGPFFAWKRDYLGGVSEPWRSLKETPLKGLPFGVPYGASIPESVDGLLATAKNMGSTHISNGAVRLQPSEMNHGESIGIAAALSVELGVRPRDLHDEPGLLNRLIGEIVDTGRSLAWFDDLGMYGTEEFFREIQYGAARGYFAGFWSEGHPLPHFGPRHEISNAEIARVVVKWMHWPIEIGPGAPHFNDVGPENPNYGYIETLVSRGIDQGCGSGRFCPGAPVTRAAATTLLVRATGAELVSPLRRSFQDVSRSHWAYESIETASALGWYAGLISTNGADALTDSSLLHPGAVLQRRELAKLLFNVDLAETPIPL
ncbi:MAG: S-layer homology domain-containing protein, partial [Planctomycetota bacterium]